MWILNVLKSSVNVMGVKVSVVGDTCAGYLVVYKDEKEALKEAEKFNCGITRINFEDIKHVKE